MYRFLDGFRWPESNGFRAAIFTIYELPRNMTNENGSIDDDIISTVKILTHRCCWGAFDASQAVFRLLFPDLLSDFEDFTEIRIIYQRIHFYWLILTKYYIFSR